MKPDLVLLFFIMIVSVLGGDDGCNKELSPSSLFDALIEFNTSSRCMSRNLTLVGPVINATTITFALPISLDKKSLSLSCSSTAHNVVIVFANDSFLEVTNAQYLVVENCRFDGGGVAGRLVRSYLVGYVRIVGSTFENVYGENVVGGAVSVAFGQVAIVSDCLFQNNYIIGISNQTGGSGVSIQGYTYSTVTGCVFLNNTMIITMTIWSAFGGVASVTDSDYVEITHNRFRDGIGVKVVGACVKINGNNSKSLILHHNEFVRCVGSGSVAGGEVVHSGGAVAIFGAFFSLNLEHTIAEDCTMDGAGDFGAAFDVVTLRSGFIRVVNVTIRNSVTPGVGALSFRVAVYTNILRLYEVYVVHTYLEDVLVENCQAKTGASIVWVTIPNVDSSYLFTPTIRVRIQNVTLRNLTTAYPKQWIPYRHIAQSQFTLRNTKLNLTALDTVLPDRFYTTTVSVKRSTPAATNTSAPSHVVGTTTTTTTHLTKAHESSTVISSLATLSSLLVGLTSLDSPAVRNAYLQRAVTCTAQVSLEKESGEYNNEELDYRIHPLQVNALEDKYMEAIIMNCVIVLVSLAGYYVAVIRLKNAFGASVCFTVCEYFVAPLVSCCTVELFELRNAGSVVVGSFVLLVSIGLSTGYLGQVVRMVHRNEQIITDPNVELRHSGVIQPYRPPCVWFALVEHSEVIFLAALTAVRPSVDWGCTCIDVAYLTIVIVPALICFAAKPYINPMDHNFRYMMAVLEGTTLLIAMVWEHSAIGIGEWLVLACACAKVFEKCWKSIVFFVNHRRHAARDALSRERKEKNANALMQELNETKRSDPSLL